MESKIRDFVFCLSDNFDSYFLGTYKVGSSTMESSARKFFHFIEYKDNKFSRSYDDLRYVRGDVSQVTSLLADNTINIVTRDPYGRLVSGLIQEICSFENKKYPGIENLSSSNKIINYFLHNYFFVYLGKNYSEFLPDWLHISKTVPTLEYFFMQDVFKQELQNWLLEAIEAYSEKLLTSNHCRPYYEPLLSFLEQGQVNNYKVVKVEDIPWRVTTAHSNKLFKDSVIYALNNTELFKGYIERENYYYSCLL